MKKITTTIASVIISLSAFSQRTFIRYDTVTLKIGECNWFMSPFEKSTVAHQDKNTIVDYIFHCIKVGKLKAFAPDSGKIIPANKILSWNLRADTVPIYNEEGEIERYQVVQAEIDPYSITRIRILQDWWLDQKNGRLFSRIACIDLMLPVYNEDATLRGYRPYCRINY
jgi:hypothetical protein